jgi:hypothetical protein
MSFRATEIRQGCEVSFLHGPDRIERGIVNGTPWVYWDGTQAVLRIPVFVPDANHIVDVAGENITAVEAHSVKVTE